MLYSLGPPELLTEEQKRLYGFNLRSILSAGLKKQRLMKERLIRLIKGVNFVVEHPNFNLKVMRRFTEDSAGRPLLSMRSPALFSGAMEPSVWAALAFGSLPGRVGGRRGSGGGGEGGEVDGPGGGRDAQGGHAHGDGKGESAVDKEGDDNSGENGSAGGIEVSGEGECEDAEMEVEVECEREAREREAAYFELAGGGGNSDEEEG